MASLMGRSLSGANARSARLSNPQRALRARRSASVVRAAITLPDTYSTLKAKGDNIVVKVAEAEKETKGGVLLPEKAQRKPTSGDVLSLGDKCSQLESGQTVLYSKFGIGCTDVKLGDADYVILREEDCIGIMPKTGADVDDVPDLIPMFDRVLIRVEEQRTVTAGGMLIPETKERPMCGEVIRVGPGKKDSEEKMPVAPGDKVIYFKYAGDVIPTTAKGRYIVVHAQDILCRNAE